MDAKKLSELTTQELLTLPLEEVSRRRVEEFFADADAVRVDTEVWKKYQPHFNRWVVKSGGQFYRKRFRGGVHLIIRLKTTIRVPKHLAGAVIGKGGHQIQFLQERFGEKIEVQVI